MRKLLLGTTALAAAATIANSAIADVSISGYYEWVYNSRSSNQATLDGTEFGSDSEIAFTFSNKTDSGLDVTMKTEFLTDAGNSAVQESSITIAGGFGSIQLGGNDGAYEKGIAAQDLIAEEATPSVLSASIGTNSDIAVADGDNNKIMYTLPAMGGLVAQASFADSGENTGTDTTSFNAQYAMDAGGASITIGGATSTTEVSGGQDNDAQNMGVKIVSGSLSLIMSQSTKENASDDIDTTGAAISYALPNGMVLGAYTMKSEDDLDTAEEYTKSGVELQYTIASGLKAFINVDDYEYTATTADGGSGGSTTATSDSGTNSKLTIQASF